MQPSSIKNQLYCFVLYIFIYVIKKYDKLSEIQKGIRSVVTRVELSLSIAENNFQY